MIMRRQYFPNPLGQFYMWIHSGWESMQETCSSQTTPQHGEGRWTQRPIPCLFKIILTVSNLAFVFSLYILFQWMPSLFCSLVQWDSASLLSRKWPTLDYFFFTPACNQIPSDLCSSQLPPQNLVLSIPSDLPTAKILHSSFYLLLRNLSAVFCVAKSRFGNAGLPLSLNFFETF